MRASFLLPLLVACAFHAEIAVAYEPPPGAARTDFQGALMRCQPYINNHKSPGEVSEADYKAYVGKRDSALAKDSQLADWDKTSLGINAKELFPQCERLMADYAAGVDAEKNPSLGSACKNNVESRLNAIIDRYYPDFKKSGPTKNGQAWFARKDLEVARWYMYLRDGWTSGLGACSHNDSYKVAFLPLKELFAKAETLVLEIEAARGVKFEKVDSSGNANHIVFIDLKTMTPVAKSDGY
jgi:hypothetical protein